MSLKSYQTASKSFVNVAFKKSSDQLPCILRNMLGEGKMAFDNFLVYIVRIAVIEGRISSQHFEDQDSSCPPVDTMAVALTADNFRG